MKSLLQLAAAFALFSIGAGAAVLAVDAHHVLRDADATIQHADKVTADVQNEIEAEKPRLDVLLANASDAVEQVNLASAEQRAYWQKTGADSDKTVKALRLVIDRAGLLLKHSDEQLNSSLLPDIDRELNTTSQTAQMSLASFEHAGTALTLQLDDPAINQLAANANQASANVAEATKHLDAATADIEQAVHRMTRPPSLVKRIGTTVLGIAAQLGSVFAGFVK